MIIDNPTRDPDCSQDQYNVRFEERRVEDLCDVAAQEPFEAVRKTSECNDEFYRTFIRPWIKAFPAIKGADLMHPLRLRRVMFSERLNPAMLPLKSMAESVRKNRHKIPEDNIYIKAERHAAQKITKAIETDTNLKNRRDERAFKALYDQSGN